MKQFKCLHYALLALFVCSIVAGIYWFGLRSGEGRLRLQVVTSTGQPVTQFTVRPDNLATPDQMGAELPININTYANVALHLDPGTYTITIQAPHFQPLTHQVQISARRTTSLEFVLTP